MLWKEPHFCPLCVPVKTLRCIRLPLSIRGPPVVLLCGRPVPAGRKFVSSLKNFTHWLIGPLPVIPVEGDFRCHSIRLTGPFSLDRIKSVWADVLCMLNLPDWFRNSLPWCELIHTRGFGKVFWGCFPFRQPSLPCSPKLSLTLQGICCTLNFFHNDPPSCCKPPLAPSNSSLPQASAGVDKIPTWFSNFNSSVT